MIVSLITRNKDIHLNLLFTLRQHDAQLDYYSRRLATASSDHTIKIFNVDGDNQTLVHTITE